MRFIVFQENPSSCNRDDACGSTVGGQIGRQNGTNSRFY